MHEVACQCLTLLIKICFVDDTVLSVSSRRAGSMKLAVWLRTAQAPTPHSAGLPISLHHSWVEEAEESWSDYSQVESDSVGPGRLLWKNRFPYMDLWCYSR